ncbi:nucleotide pyrophosphohydrolase [Aquabacterium sp.]|uniref:nucleotide pyrophosphohydrolase n=1 Tax=Aquabacterium sp. TaxID=1872578 RepID=UPI0025BBE5AB|nr:nucleotide pyrophosphohydrolase [Aquabacterium sp.]
MFQALCPSTVSADQHKPASVAQLAQRLQQFADARDWGQFHSPKNLASALIVEAGELLEHFQWMTEEQSRLLDVDKKQAVAHEMADVLLYLVQLSSSLGVDLMAAASEKMAINERKYPVDQARGSSKKSDVS